MISTSEYSKRSGRPYGVCRELVRRHGLGKRVDGKRMLSDDDIEFLEKRRRKYLTDEKSHDSIT